MRNKKGQFIKGQHYSPKTEFKKGQHWRKKQLYWNKEWLYNEYIVKGKSAADIAKKFGCWDRNIIYFLHKYESSYF